MFKFKLFPRKFMGNFTIQILTKEDDEVRGSITVSEKELKWWEELANDNSIQFD